MLDRFNLIAEEINANGEADLIAGFLEFAGQVDVNNPASHREITRHFHLIEPVIAMIGKPDDEFFRLEFLTDAEGADEIAQLIAAGHRLHEGMNGCDEDIGTI